MAGSEPGTLCLALSFNVTPDRAASENKNAPAVAAASWTDTVMETPPPRRKTRADSPRPSSSLRSLSVRSGDSESCSSRGGRSRSLGGEDGARIPLGDYFCQVCLEDRPACAGFVLSACGHAFCRACLKGYVLTKVNDGQVYPACFHDVKGGGEDESGKQEEARGEMTRRHAKSCGIGIKQRDIEILLASEGDRTARRKYSRFLFCREHSTARECPRCNKLQVGDPLESEMRCVGCGAEYCYFHGGAHEGKTCADHIESTADETGRSLALIRRLTKPCPGCQTPVEKLGGCNQMICYHCSASFCWICGQEVDRGTFPVHFQWWNVRGCPNQQLQEDASRTTGGRQCHQILSILQIVIIGPPALILTVLSSLACMCCLPAFKLTPRQLFTGCFSGWGNFVMVLPVLPFLLVGAVVVGIIYIAMLPYQLASAISRKYRLEKMDAAANATAGSAGGSCSSMGGSDTAKWGGLIALEDGFNVASAEADGEAGGRMGGAFVGPRPASPSLPSSSTSSQASPMAEILRSERQHRQERKSIVLRRQQLLQLQQQDRRLLHTSAPSPFWTYSSFDSRKTHSTGGISTGNGVGTGIGPRAVGGGLTTASPHRAPLPPPPSNSGGSWDLVGGDVDVDVEAALASISLASESKAHGDSTMTVAAEPSVEPPGLLLGTSMGMREMVGLWLGASPFAVASGAGGGSSGDGGLGSPSPSLSAHMAAAAGLAGAGAAGAVDAIDDCE